MKTGLLTNIGKALKVDAVPAAVDAVHGVKGKGRLQSKLVVDAGDVVKQGNRIGERRRQRLPFTRRPQGYF